VIPSETPPAEIHVAVQESKESGGIRYNNGVTKGKGCDLVGDCNILIPVYHIYQPLDYNYPFYYKEFLKKSRTPLT